MIKKYKPNSLQELKELVSDKSVHLGDIDTSLITDMTELFKDSTRKNFDGLETWDTSNVTTMKGMFCVAKYFNHPIGDWDVSKVENMSYMFCEAPAFNQPLEKWDVSNVCNMKAMLHFAKSFNQPLNGWDMSGVGIIWAMFAGAKSFNQPLDKWILPISVKCSTHSPNVMSSTRISTRGIRRTSKIWTACSTVRKASTSR